MDWPGAQGSDTLSLLGTISCYYLFEAAVQVELPPVQVIRVEGEIIILATVAGVGKNVAPALRKAQEDVTETGTQYGEVNKHVPAAYVP